MTDLPALAHRMARAMAQSLPGLAVQQTMAPSVRRNNPMADERTIRMAGVLLLLYVQQETLHLPLIVRPEYDGPHSGQVALPGGRQEPSDPDLWHTALREAEEEIGIARHRVRYIGRLTPIFIPNSRYRVQPCVGWMTGAGPFSPDAGEVYRILEIPVDMLLHAGCVAQETWQIRDQAIEVPFYRFQEYRIWGATAMILAEFLHIRSRMPH